MANADNKYARLLADPNFNTSGQVRDVQKSLALSKLKIVPNPAHHTKSYKKLPTHYTTSTVERKLSQANCLIT